MSLRPNKEFADIGGNGPDSISATHKRQINQRAVFEPNSTLIKCICLG
jgi:hypothetical protein